MTNDTITQTNRKLATQRKLWLAIAIAFFALVGAGYGVYWATVLRYEQTTDDAYVSGNVVQITPQISGTVISIGADDTQFVKAGQPLVRLDPADAKVALDQSEAQLGRTVRDVLASIARRSRTIPTSSRRRPECATRTSPTRAPRSPRRCRATLRSARCSLGNA